MGMFDFVKNAGSKISGAVTGMLGDKEAIFIAALATTPLPAMATVIGGKIM